MVNAATWVRNLRLTTADAVFDGREARAMRQLLGLESEWSDQPARASSIAEQAQLVSRLDARYRMAEALQIATTTGLDGFGAAGRAVLFARTLRDVERALNVFAPLLNLRHAVALRRTEAGLVFALRSHASQCSVAGSQLRLVDCAKLGRFIDDLLAHHRLARGPDEIDHGASPSGLPLPRQLDGLLPKASITEIRRNEKAARKEMRELEHANLGNTVRRILIAGAGDRLPDLAEVAKQLGYSQRTFRRRLTERGTSFMECVNDVRHHLALRYLATTNCTVATIAERLGYSDTANFRQAFRRWTGVSPRAFVARTAADLPVNVMRTRHHSVSYAGQHAS